MATNVKNLCRLCAKEEEITKDLFEAIDIGSLKLIKDLVQISINEDDGLPTKICLNCEEKMVSFQLFILECLKAQDYLKNIYLKNNEGSDDKYNNKIENNSKIIKSEIKDEFSNDDIDMLCAAAMDNEVENNYDEDYHDASVQDDDSEGDESVTLATLNKQDKVKLEPQPKIEKCFKKKKERSDNRLLQKTSDIKIKDYIKFTCPVCQITYSSWYTLRNHTKRNHKMSPYVQCLCGITLKSKSVMYKHVQDHRNPNMYNCDKCPRIVKTLEALNKHKMRHVPKAERKFICATCDKVCFTKDSLKSHQKSHIPIDERKIYSCDVCDLKFTTRSSASSHKRVVHDKIKQYVCDLCGYACGTNGELRQHRAIHSEDKPHVCKTCNKPFKTYANLKTHMDTHEDTSYQCYVCNRILNSRRTLRKHLLVHDEKCTHDCPFCHKAFKRRQTLKVHLYTHTGDKPLTCKWCDERFSYASTLRSHRLRCHPDKMAAQPHATSYQYGHAPAQVPVSMPMSMQVSLPEVATEYIKNDITITKNEAM